MSTGGRSTFMGPAALLPNPFAQAARSLYAACRAVDDMADETGGAVAQRALRQLDEDLARHAARSDTAETFLRLHKSHDLDLGQARHLVLTVASDLYHRPFASWPQLMNYAQGVAGTVGFMMCDILDVRDADARNDGAALGRAMQLTNIARDVKTDAQMGRRYLPQQLCPLSPDRLAQDRADDDAVVRTAVGQVLEQAETLYDQGLRGLAALSPSVRIGIAAAALSYRDIGRRIGKRDHRAHETRPRPTGLRRAVLVSQAAGLALCPPRQEIDHAS